MEIRDVDAPVENWAPPVRPDRLALEGRFAALRNLDPAEHAAPIFAANRGDDSLWDYMPYGPFADLADYERWARNAANGSDPLFLAILDKERGHWAGVASFMRIDPAMGVIEIGAITFAPVLQRTRAATEALYSMMKWAFDAGYRRVEWKCNASNMPSRRAAGRLGSSYEGIFRQAAVIKGRNRDTAWFAAIDADWPALNTAFERWLAPENFDARGLQKTSLRDLTGALLMTHDPCEHTPGQPKVER